MDREVPDVEHRVVGHGPILAGSARDGQRARR
jgi:hypothetical protein